jgi:hypothetical protein
VRATKDVDAIVEILSLTEYQSFLEALPAHLPGDIASQARLPELLNRLRLLTQ